MTVAKYEPVIREEYLRSKNFGKEGYLSFRYRSPCEGWLYFPPLPTQIQASSVVSFAISGSCSVPGSTAASGSAKTRGSWLRGCKRQYKDLFFVPGSTAASGSTRTRGSWIHGCIWQSKDQLLYLAPRLQVAV